MSYDEYGTHALTSTHEGPIIHDEWGHRSTGMSSIPSIRNLQHVLDECVEQVEGDVERVVAEEFSRTRRYHSGESGDVYYARVYAVHRGTGGTPRKTNVSYASRQIPDTAPADLARAVAEHRPKDGGSDIEVISEEGLSVPVRLQERAATVFVHEVFGHGLEVDPSTGVAPLQRCPSLPTSIELVDERLAGGNWGSSTLDDRGAAVSEVDPTYITGGQLVRTISADGPDLYQSRAGQPLVARARSIRLSAVGDTTPLDIFPRVDIASASFARLNRTTRRARLYFDDAATAWDDDGTPSMVKINYLTFSLDQLSTIVLGLGTEVERINALCDKRGQRLPVTTASPELLVAPAGLLNGRR